MSRHIPRHQRWSKHGPAEYRCGAVVVRIFRGAWWAEVPFEERPERNGELGPWEKHLVRIGPYKRPRNAMMAAEERILLLSRRPDDRVRVFRLEDFPHDRRDPPAHS